MVPRRRHHHDGGGCASGICTHAALRRRRHRPLDPPPVRGADARLLDGALGAVRLADKGSSAWERLIMYYGGMAGVFGFFLSSSIGSDSQWVVRPTFGRARRPPGLPTTRRGCSPSRSSRSAWVWSGRCCTRVWSARTPSHRQATAREAGEGSADADAAGDRAPIAPSDVKTLLARRDAGPLARSRRGERPLGVCSAEGVGPAARAVGGGGGVRQRDGSARADGDRGARSRGAERLQVPERRQVQGARAALGRAPRQRRGATIGSFTWTRRRDSTSTRCVPHAPELEGEPSHVPDPTCAHNPRQTRHRTSPRCRCATCSSTA